MSDSEMVEFLLDQLRDSDVSARAMFGGHLGRNGGESARRSFGGSVRR